MITIEKTCDDILKNLKHHAIVPVSSVWDDLKISRSSLRECCLILLKDEHIKCPVDPLSPEFVDSTLQITNKGISFIENKSYVYLSSVKDAELKKILQDVKKNEFFFKTKWLPIVISIVSLIISLIALLKK